MNSMVEHQGGEERALATAAWASIEDITRQKFAPGKFWLGCALDPAGTPIGFADDRHICMVAGTRSGKGTTFIINNLCLWPGSVVVVDPKGENATVTAARRGRGSEYCEGLGQEVYVLDPFKAATMADEYRASFNPLDALDPDHEETVDEAGRIADALIVINQKDPFWDEQARTLVKALILYVLTDDLFEGARNLVTVRALLTSGDTATRDAFQEMAERGEFAGEEIPSPFWCLFKGMRQNDAFGGIIARSGESFGHLLDTSAKTFNSILSSARNQTEFIDSPPMQRSLSETTPGFSLPRLKTDPKGISLYLSLPQRFMNTHYRWLRMIVSLTITEMEKTRGQPACGHRVLMCLDEFAGLKKMEVIENAAAQIAGAGVKLFFVLQYLTQLKDIYKDNWEGFLANAGLKIFFDMEDGFTREYVSKFIGETEVTRTTQSQSQTKGTSSSHTSGRSWSSSTSTSRTSGSSIGGSSAKNSGVSLTSSLSTTNGSSFTTGGSSSSTYGTSESKTAGVNEGIHKRALMTPDELGRAFSRIDDKNNSAYPGLALVLISGRKPLVLRKTNYFDNWHFIGHFDPHPDHNFVSLSKPPPLPPRLTKTGNK
ncbi:MAG: type IV secretory system conjugative DNA transfer family protein [bacterium]|nr:type IV secretory system conjugative DNA transfer family protein [bacterium]